VPAVFGARAFATKPAADVVHMFRERLRCRIPLVSPLDRRLQTPGIFPGRYGASKNFGRVRVIARRAQSLQYLVANRRRRPESALRLPKAVRAMKATVSS